jgi:hypothetical protein
MEPVSAMRDCDQLDDPFLFNHKPSDQSIAPAIHHF